MRILYAGYRTQKQRAEDEQKGVKPEHRKNLSDFDKRLKSGEFGNNPDMGQNVPQTPQNSF